jgi:hypothetical protein
MFLSEKVSALHTNARLTGPVAQGEISKNLCAPTNFSSVRETITTGRLKLLLAHAYCYVYVKARRARFADAFFDQAS